jgi:hypothetical protein
VRRKVLVVFIVDAPNAVMSVHFAPEPAEAIPSESTHVWFQQMMAVIVRKTPQQADITGYFSNHQKTGIGTGSFRPASLVSSPGPKASARERRRTRRHEMNRYPPGIDGEHCSAFLSGADYGTCDDRQAADPRGARDTAHGRCTNPGCAAR